MTVAGSGPRALLVHGSMSFGALAFSEQRPLAGRFELSIVDRRGFGHSSDGEGRVDFERDAGEIAGLLDAPVHLVGHSYGGIVVMLAAALAPAQVRSVTVIEPPAFGLVRGDPAVEEMIARIAAVRAQPGEGEESFLLGFLRAWGLEPRPGPALNRVARRSVRRSMDERPPDEAEIPLAELAAAPFPLLVCRGAWDQAPERARALAGRAFAAVCDVLVERAGAEPAVFAGAAHQPQMLGAPFNDRLAAFWTGDSPPNGGVRNP